MIPLILVTIVIAVLFVSVRVVKELDPKSKTNKGTSASRGKSSFSLKIPSNNVSVSLASQGALLEENSHSLVEAEFSGSLEPVKERSPLSDLTVKCEKLEQMMGEKNKEIMALQKDLEVEKSMQREFETLKRTYLEQIEELKMQNRRSKEELQSVFRENEELKSTLQSRLSPVSEEHIRAAVDMSPDIYPDPPEKQNISLKDVINKYNFKKEGDV